MEKRDLKDILLKSPTEIASIAEEEELQHIVRMLWAVSLDGGESKAIKKAAKKENHGLITKGGNTYDVFGRNVAMMKFRECGRVWENN